ncbi:MAG: hypothetical protein ABR971_07370 [Acidobacteriaceae bacterium]
MCVILPFMILAWGTAYKLSLYTTAKREAPAKVSTRGSDAAKSSVSHAIDGHKVVGNGIVPSLPVNSSRVLPEFRDAASAEFHPVILSLHSAPNLAARPPPIKAHFAS